MSSSVDSFSQVLISSPTLEEANRLSDTLLKERLIAGSLIIRGDSRYWWEGELVEKPYWNIQAFTLLRRKESIIAVVEELSVDECPIVAFVPLDGNAKFLKWIEESIS